MPADDPTPSRCSWVDLSKPDYVAYHDQEWGKPIYADQKIFEFLVLESAQAGLSWYTILRKREGYRQAFADFDPQRVAQFTDVEVQALLANPAIVRNRLKIQATITNAQRFLAVQQEFGSFAKYIWSFVGGKPLVREIKTPADWQTTSPESDALSHDLKKRGFKFLGSTVCYAHMQATGMIIDHSADCFCRQAILDTL